MQLVKLEIKGFKSFGDKVVINFDNGVTGIVGPNGCGKSNIVDAIRWVLGEQRTKALRSEKMDNVIFNGTKRRKALQMAEVSLTFDNTKNLIPTEYTQVQITRRYYRSGESEYLLNGVQCRLKDISNLFLDTGIGSDSYAIIELKMIDDILNDKDNSRRSLFEEAAGISKFKVRKKQTLKKLEDTDKDLERVEDILYEIEKNLKSLEKQAKQAEKYLKYRDEQKRYSIDLAKITIERKQVEINELTKELDNFKDNKLKLHKDQDVIQAELEKLKATLIQKEQILASRQKTLNEFVNNLRQQESDKKVKNERLVFLQEKQNSLKDNLHQEKLKTEEINHQINTLKDTLAATQENIADINTRVQNLKDDHDNQKEQTHKVQGEINGVNTNFKTQQDKVFELQKSLEVNQIRLKSLQEELNKTIDNQGNHTLSIEQKELELQNLAKQLQEKNQHLASLEQKEEHNNLLINNQNEVINAIKDELVAANRSIDSTQNEYNLTKSLVDNLEGFPEAIKFLKKNTKIGETTPLLSDIITCDEKYRIAIENFLEGVMNYYVVNNATEAYTAVNILSDSSKGKAHFYVLKSFENFNPTPKTKIKNCTPAIDLIEFDKPYQKLVEYILDDVYLCTDDNIPEEDHIIISQSGKFTKRNYSISGGSVGLFEGKRIGRVKNLEKLEVQIKELDVEREA
ncbi:chromosome segregation protein SMC, partial [Cyclobacteriaceae bacterium]|nr:chromosome segregation protein SMC [Cyclobacteriaceae bacterium]